MTLKKQTIKKLVLQKKLYFYAGFGILVTVFGIIYLTAKSQPDTSHLIPTKRAFDTNTRGINTDNIRIAKVEKIGEAIESRMQHLESSNIEQNSKYAGLLREKEAAEMQHEQHISELSAKVENLIEENRDLEETLQNPAYHSMQAQSSLEETSEIGVFEKESVQSKNNVYEAIPAATVVKAVLMSGVDCSVGTNQPTGPNRVLLWTLDDGVLPNCRVPLKRCAILGTAVGNLSEERVKIRAEKLITSNADGTYESTDISAYITGEDGREGVRGVVVSRTGALIAAAALSSAMQGGASTLQTILNNQTVATLARVSANQSILNLDMARNVGLQGAHSATEELTKHFIDEAKKLQPTIQIAAGRFVDIIFNDDVVIGERNLQKKFDEKRRANNG